MEVEGGTPAGSSRTGTCRNSHDPPFTKGPFGSHMRAVLLNGAWTRRRGRRRVQVNCVTYYQEYHVLLGRLGLRLEGVRYVYLL
jgi:hypothetical protein